MDKKYVLAIDQGTTSTRSIIFDHGGKIIASYQKEHEQIYPKPGWVEHDPMEIWDRAKEVVQETLRHVSVDEIAAVGITNQRETTVVWNKKTGKPVYNAIVWQDTRTDKICNTLAADGGQDRFREKVGLPLATYFSGPKVKWVLENVDGAKELADKNELLFGNIDSWLIWNLTGGVNGGSHVTDVTNASRTMLMNLKTLQWDDEILKIMGVPKSMLPEIRPSSDPKVYGHTTENGPFKARLPVSGDLGDQQAATVGQACLKPGEVKNTYGTGCFMILNTGHELVHSKNGLLTTLCYKFGDEKPVYALEGSIAITGALVQWLRDNIGLIKSSDEVEGLARTVEDNGGVYFVPAFSGLFAPYWRSDARGAIVGMTRYVNKGHLARATLEASAFQTKEVLDAMNADSGVPITTLKVDGGMVKNELLMQFQSDILGIPVVRPVVAETTSLGAAYAAGLAVGFWKDTNDIINNWQKDKDWSAKMSSDDRAKQYKLWKKAVTKTFDWVDE